MIVCHCAAVSDSVIRPVLDRPGATLADVTAHCGAGGNCGSCVQTIRTLLEQRSSESRVALASAV